MIRKIMIMLISLWVMVTLTFVMMKAIPGDPFSEEKALSAEMKLRLNRHWGLDQPFITQYFQYLRSIITWDLGPSMVHQGRTVNQIIRDGFPVSALIGAEALVLATLFGSLIGIASALTYGKFTHRLLFLLGICFVSVPSFILAPFLQYFFAYKLHWLPLARWGSWTHTLLPSLTLSAYPTAFIARLMRTSLSETLRSDYVKNARAKGLSEKEVLFRHALPNSLIPPLSYLGQVFVAVLTGSFIVEKIFGIPGLGSWYVNGIINRDYPVIMGTTVFYSALLMVVIFLTDILFTVLDPRIKHE